MALSESVPIRMSIAPNWSDEGANIVCLEFAMYQFDSLQSDWPLKNYRFGRLHY